MKVKIYHYQDYEAALDRILREGLYCGHLMGNPSHKRAFRHLDIDDAKCIYGRLVPDLFRGAKGIEFEVDLDKTRAFIGDQDDLDNMDEYERRLMDLKTYLELPKERQKEIRTPEVFVDLQFVPPSDLRYFES